MESRIFVYTDGACKNNGSKHALGGVGVYWGPDDPRNVSRHMGLTTNNICELTAIQVALDAVLAQRHKADDLTRYVIFSDSMYSLDCVGKWYDGFVRRNWISKAGTPVKNKDLIIDIRRKLNLLGDRVLLQYVKGHSGHPGNDAADALAVLGRDNAPS